MNSYPKRYVRALAACLCACLLLGPLSAPAAADVKTQIKLNIGQPNVWSLSQAHYLLALLRDKNRSVAITQPTLDPNAVDGARIDILRTMLGIDAQFSAPQGLQNSVAQQQFNADFARKQAAITRIDELSRERLNVAREISRLESELAKLPPAPEEDEEGDPAVERRRAELTRIRDAQQALNTTLQAEITTLTPQANATTALTGLSTTAPFGAPAALPNLPNDFSDIKSLVDKLLGNTAQPKVNASQALDNYINIQYEKLAKELTLLRDEVGPSERLIFLELPSSLYTVPKKDDDIMVQLEWGVDEYVGLCPEKGEAGEIEKLLDAARAQLNELDPQYAREERLNAQGGGDEADYSTTTVEQKPPLTDDVIDKFLKTRTKARMNLVDNVVLRDKYARLLDAIEGLDASYDSLFGNKRISAAEESKLEPQAEMGLRMRRRRVALAHRFAERLKAEGADYESFKQKLTATEPADKDERAAFAELRRMLRLHPTLRGSGRVGLVDEDGSVAPRARPEEYCVNPAETSKFRVVDIIPRQSALNVNDVHATQKGFALAAQFLAIFGFGGKVSYERQRTHYEQFINQDVFASGFGKGLSRFGWTMGPLPGTRRLAPGPRTTFAVMAIPKDAQRVTLRASGKAFKRTKDPNNDADSKRLNGDTGETFDIMIPNEETEGFWVDSLNYTPVPKGQRVTVVIGGRYFSPLTGVMIDGIPLKRAIAIAKHESDTTTIPNDTNSPGEYEYINSTQLVASFTRSTAGTPLITLVSPEKTATINYFRDLTINFHFTDSLLHRSQIEPMFIDGFALTRLEVKGDPRGYDPVDAVLIGTGLRRRAELSVNGLRIPDADVQLLNTGAYAFRVADPRDPELRYKPWTVTYRVGQEAASVVYDPSTDGLRADSPTIESIENPTTGKAEGLVGGGYTVIIRGGNLQNVTQVTFGSARPVRLDAGTLRHPNVLLVKAPKGTEGGAQVLLEGYAGGRAVSNILDFVTPGKAIFKYVPKPKPPATARTTTAARRR